MGLTFLGFFEVGEADQENFTFDGDFASDWDLYPESVFLECCEARAHDTEQLTSHVLSLLEGQVDVAEEHVFPLR